jgi:hypothetical protein
MTCTHQTNLGQQWMKLRKERGKIACLEKARITEAVYGAEGQGKACMAKAILPEPQFAAAYDRGNVAERLTRHTGWKEDRALRFSLQTVHPAHPLYGGVSERTGRLNTPKLPTRVITGCPVAGVGAIRRPVWARSRHSTQMPGVMAGTAAGELADGRRNKCGAIRMKIRWIGGRTAATAIQQSSTEAC